MWRHYSHEYRYLVYFFAVYENVTYRYSFVISRLECTRVHFVQVSVSVSRPEDPGLGLETWWPRSLVLFQGIECVTSSSGLEFVGYLECKQSFWLTKIRDNITETYVVSKTVADFAEILLRFRLHVCTRRFIVYVVVNCINQAIPYSSCPISWRLE